MKIHRLSGATLLWHSLAIAGLTSLLPISAAYAAATDIEVWISLTEHNKVVFEKLVKKFNSDQEQVKVKLKSFDFPEAVESALAAGGKSKPKANLVQLDHNNDPAEVTSRSYIMPLYSLLAKHPVKNAKWFLSEHNTFARDDRGRLLAFPYMAEIPVMYYNIDAFKKAGIKPEMPSRSWRALQDQLVQLANNGSRQCPLTSDEPVSVNLENLAALNRQPYTSAENGLKQGKIKPSFLFDVMYVRHLSVMVSWVRSELMVPPESESRSTTRFAKGECAVLMSGSGSLGRFNDVRSLDFGVVGLPYYPELTKTPGNPFVEGAALWATSGHGAAQDKATAGFIAWLAEPTNAASWYQQTGFLPVTQQAFSSTDGKYYKNLGQWHDVVDAYEKQPAPTARGFRIRNYAKIRAMFRQTLDRALSGEQPAVTALKFANTQASKLMH